MPDVPYSTDPGSVIRFLERIPGSGVPEKVTLKYLPSVGFKSTNHRPIIRFLKTLGFLDTTGVPTQVWRDYRNKKNGPTVLAAAIRQAYSDLFNVYPDAERQDTEAIHNFFASNSDLAEGTLLLAVRLFGALCAKADFGTELALPEPAAPEAPQTGAQTPPLPIAPTPAGQPSVNINIELHLPPTDDASVYDKLFAAMKKHLFPDAE